MKTFPDIGSVIDYMNAARDRGDEELRRQYEPFYELSQFHGYGWTTHIPLLASVVATARPGPVLEIGVGRGSSPLLVELCRAMGRDLVGLDSDLKWIDEIGDALDYPIHHVANWTQLPGLLEVSLRGPWSVIFIDHGPAEARLPVLKACRGHAEFIVCHDTHNPGYLVGFDDYLDTFKYRSDYTGMAAQTSVVSDVRAYAGAR
jgi:predicted O-methyltransferase YrrM